MELIGFTVLISFLIIHLQSADTQILFKNTNDQVGEFYWRGKLFFKLPIKTTELTQPNANVNQNNQSITTHSNNHKNQHKSSNSNVTYHTYHKNGTNVTNDSGKIKFNSDDILAEGDPCTRTYGAQAGVCTPVDDCRHVYDDYRINKIKIDICGYDGIRPVICCTPPPLPPAPTSPPAPHPTSASPILLENTLNSHPAVLANRISRAKCEEYSNIGKKTFNFSPLLIDAPIYEYSVSDCEFTSNPLIVGGEVTKVGEFPHMALIGWTEANNVEWSCGGSLISDYFVMTAAHCTSRSGVRPDIIRLGEQNTARTDDGANPIDIKIAEIIIHPEYRRPSKYNDIALIKLEKRVELTRRIMPACLWQDASLNYTQTIATGWGKIDTNGFQSEELLKVNLEIYGNSVCQDIYQVNGRNFPNGIINSQICAGDMNSNKDTCQGDSGGPIQIKVSQKSCVHHVIGVTSFGGACGSGMPAIYSKVSSFIDWIESIVWPSTFANVK